MSKLKKIASFTLTEMILTLAISSIVAGLAFTIVTLFSYNMNLIGENYNQKTQSDLLHGRLLIDFNRFSNIYISPNTENLILSSPIDSITYRFTDSLVIREQDTIFISAYKKTWFRFGEEVRSGGVDAIKIEYDTQQKPYLFVSITSDAKTYLKVHGN